MQTNTNKQRNAVIAVFIIAAIFSLTSCSTSKQVGNVSPKQSFAITCSNDTIFYNR